jgi:hypothetical protein
MRILLNYNNSYAVLSFQKVRKLQAQGQVNYMQRREPKGISFKIELCASTQYEI